MMEKEKFIVDGQELGYYDGDYIVITDEATISETLAEMEE